MIRDFVYILNEVLRFPPTSSSQLCVSCIHCIYCSSNVYMTLAVKRDVKHQQPTCNSAEPYSRLGEWCQWFTGICTCFFLQLSSHRSARKCSEIIGQKRQPIITQSCTTDCPIGQSGGHYTFTHCQICKWVFDER